MAQRVDEAYVLGTQELAEADLIVTLLAEHAGRVRAVARAARKSRRRFGGALEPLTRVSARWSEREGRELHRLESLDVVRSFAALQREPALQAACAVIVEIVSACTREEQPDPKGFRLIGAVLDAMEGDLDPWIAIRYFEYWTLKLQGVLPDLQTCHGCGSVFSSGQTRLAGAAPGLLCQSCAASHAGRTRRISTADATFLADAPSHPPEAMSRHARAARRGGALETLLRGSLEAFVERGFRAYRHVSPPGPRRTGSEC